METVRCEELQLELSATLKSKSGSSTSRHHTSQYSSLGGTTATVTWAPTPTHLPSQQHNHLSQLTGTSSSIPSSDTHKSNHTKIGNIGNTGSEIDRIIAKIEQARLQII